MPILLPESANWTTNAARGEHGRVACLQAASESVAQRRWALTADLHLSANPDTAYGTYRTLDNTARTLSEVSAAAVDGVIVNGDLAGMHGLPADYGRVAETLAGLAAKVPVALTPGNHDRRDHMLKRFHPEAFSLNEPAKLITVIDAANVRFILLDSLYRTDVVPGLLGQAQRRWLARLLDSEDRRATLIVVHHPLGDDDGALLDGDRLLEIVQPRPQVKAVFTAHDHAWRVEQRGKLHVVKLPSAAFAFEPGEAIGWVEAELCACGARLRLHSGGTADERSLEWRP
jgi:3',5'-cyclic AMP phosphodiesterase CpdA